MANGFNPLQSFAQGLNIQQGMQDMQRQEQLSQLRAAIGQQAGQAGFNPNQSLELQQLAALDPTGAINSLTAFNAIGQERQKAFFQDARKGRRMLDAGDVGGFTKLVENRLGQINAVGGDPSDSMAVLSMVAQGDIEGAKAALNQVEMQGVELGLLSDIKATKDRGKPADIIALEKLIERAGLSEEDAKTAARIKLGLDPRATGSADITIAQKDLANEVADVKATIKQAEKFGELTGASRAKAIDKGFEQITKVNNNIGNLNRAIQLLDEGAKTGAVERFLPSVKAATVELNNLRNRLGLDVIGSVTFGVLSEGELNLALDTALPTGLNEPELKDWLQRKKAAQEKLRGYLEDQINFLDQGGTKAGFMRMKKNQSAQPDSPAQRTEQEILSQYGV